jgi:hypothetical protein
MTMAACGIIDRNECIDAIGFPEKKRTTFLDVSQLAKCRIIRGEKAAARLGELPHRFARR